MTFCASQSRRERCLPLGDKRGVMSQKLKTDIALFAAAFIASAFVLGANTGLADILGFMLKAH